MLGHCGKCLDIHAPLVAPILVRARAQPNLPQIDFFLVIGVDPVLNYLPSLSMQKINEIDPNSESSQRV